MDASLDSIDRASAGPPHDVAADPPRPRHFAIVEGTAVGITVACVWLTGEQNVWGWPTGIVGSLLYLYVFHRTRLYSDVLLQGYFIVTSVYGWYSWTHGSSPGGELAVSRLTPAAGVAWLALLAAGTVALGTVMKRYTRAALPYRDAAIAIGSVVAQYQLTEKILESWILWIAVDALATAVYAARRLFMTAVLYAVLLLLAARGLVEWLGVA